MECRFSGMIVMGQRYHGRQSGPDRGGSMSVSNLSLAIAAKQHLLERCSVVRVTRCVNNRVHQTIGVMHVLDHRDQRVQVMPCLTWAYVVQDHVEKEEWEPANEKEYNDESDHHCQFHFLLESPMLLLSVFHRVEDDHV